MLLNPTRSGYGRAAYNRIRSFVPDTAQGYNVNSRVPKYVYEEPTGALIQSISGGYRLWMCTKLLFCCFSNLKALLLSKGVLLLLLLSIICYCLDDNKYFGILDLYIQYLHNIIKYNMELGEIRGWCVLTWLASLNFEHSFPIIRLFIF